MVDRPIRRRFGTKSEQGDALVLVITSIFLVGIVVTSLVSVTLTATAKSASTRAHSQALAAAEGGIDATARQLISANPPNCYASYSSPTGAVPEYSINVEFIPPGGTNYQPCNGSPLPPLAESVRFTATGIAQAKGSQRDRTKDEATVERVLNRPGKSRFNEAIFGDVYTQTNSTYIIHPDRGPDGTGTPIPSDIVTRGQWNCPANSTIAGNVYALGGAVTSTNCTVDGELFVVGNLTASSKVTVKKNLWVKGNLQSSTADLTVGTTGIDNGNALVHGNVQLTNPGNKIMGDLRATGSYSTSNPDTINNHIGGTAYFGGGLGGSGWTYDELTTRSGSKLRINQPTTGPDWELPSIMTENKTPEDLQRLNFPFVMKDDEMFDGFARRTWTEIGQANGIFQNGGTGCNGIGLQGTLVINQDTFIDGTNCSGVTFNYGSLNVELNADAVLYVNDFSSSINVNIIAGTNSSLTNRHTLYVMVAPSNDPSKHTCSPIPSGVGNLRLSTGTWDTSAKNGRLSTKIMLYSAGVTNLTLTNSNVTSGQVYGCQVLFPSSFTMTYAKSGPELNENLLDLRTAWSRDITF